MRLTIKCTVVLAFSFRLLCAVLAALHTLWISKYVGSPDPGLAIADVLVWQQVGPVMEGLAVSGGWVYSSWYRSAAASNQLKGNIVAFNMKKLNKYQAQYLSPRSFVLMTRCASAIHTGN